MRNDLEGKLALSVKTLKLMLFELCESLFRELFLLYVTFFMLFLFVQIALIPNAEKRVRRVKIVEVHQNVKPK